MNKNTLILAGILLALVIIAFVLLQRPGETSLTESERDLLIEIDSTSVNSINIISRTSSITLVRTGTEWFLNHPVHARADQSLVGTFLREASRLSVHSVVSNRPEKHSIFQVDSTGTSVTFFRESGDSVSITLGKFGPSFADVYARRAGSNDVVLMNASFMYTVNRSAKEWRDHSILQMPAENIQEIDFQYGDTTFTLAWKDSVWMIGTFQVQESAAKGLIRALSSLRADDFLDTVLPAKAKHVAAVTVSGVSIQWYQSPANERYLVQTSSSPQWYQVDQWKAQQVLKRKRDLITSR